MALPSDKDTRDQRAFVLDADGNESRRVAMPSAQDASGNLNVNVLSDANDMDGGGKISVGTTAVEATFTGTTKTIIITSDVSNTGILWVGESNVSSAGANALATLQPGQTLILEYDDTSNAVFVISDTSSQNFWKGALV